MKTIANVYSTSEVDALRILLGSAGIDIFVPDEVSATLLPHHFMTRTGIRVQVNDEDEAAALQVIGEHQEQEHGEEG